MSAMWKLVRLAVAAALLAALFPATAFAATPASGDPTAVVSVIVTRADASGGAEGAVAAVGGRITGQLDIVDAFTAEVPQWATAFIASNPSVGGVALDGPAISSAKTVDMVADPVNYYLDTTGARRVWGLKDSAGKPVDGAGVGIAIVDSGVASNENDFYSVGSNNTYRVTKALSFNPNSSTYQDVYGHGTHVAGIAAGAGNDSGGRFTGMAPGASIVSLKIADEQGRASESDVVKALQWVYENKAAYNIRVVNLSVNCGVSQSYHESPLDAACEILWFNGVVVVTSAGNSGNDRTYSTICAAPANDPFVITVGAANESYSGNPNDDYLADYTERGTTTDGYSKPDIFAPGSNIHSVVSKRSGWATLYPDRVVWNGEYFRISGTSMAAPMVSGAAALILQKEPKLTPDQVKYRLLNSYSYTIGAGKASYPYLDAYKAVTSGTTASANTGIPVSRMLTTGTDPVLNSSVMWNSVMWNSVMWNSVMWNSVMWAR